MFTRWLDPYVKLLSPVIVTSWMVHNLFSSFDQSRIPQIFDRWQSCNRFWMLWNSFGMKTAGKHGTFFRSFGRFVLSSCITLSSYNTFLGLFSFPSKPLCLISSGLFWCNYALFKESDERAIHFLISTAISQTFCFSEIKLGAYVWALLAAAAIRMWPIRLAFKKLSCFDCHNDF